MVDARHSTSDDVDGQKCGQIRSKRVVIKYEFLIEVSLGHLFPTKGKYWEAVQKNTINSRLKNESSPLSHSIKQFLLPHQLLYSLFQQLP